MADLGARSDDQALHDDEAPADLEGPTGVGTTGDAAGRVRLTPLVFGVAFAGLGALYLLGGVIDDATWVWVVGLTTLAVAGLVSAIRS